MQGEAPCFGLKHGVVVQDFLWQCVSHKSQRHLPRCGLAVEEAVLWLSLSTQEEEGVCVHEQLPRGTDILTVNLPLW